MLRRDANARFYKSGFWIFTSYQFVSGKLSASFTPSEYSDIESTESQTPVKLCHDDVRNRTWWKFQGEYYWEDEGYSATVMKALLLERLGQRERRIQRAMALMEQREILDPQDRIPIPDEVKLFVWRRDGGRCVKCGSNQRLEFDHVIPVALGGGNTARNLQLLCEDCNRSKGASIA